MATGDISSVTIRSDGWTADVVVSGFTTGASYNYGLGTNNAPGSAKVVFTVTSLAFSGGSATTGTRTVYGVFTARKAYPSQTSKDETGGGNLTFRMVLSRPIFQKDNTGAGNSGTAPTVTISAALVTNSGGAGQTSNAATNLTVTNNSTLAWPKVVGRWAQSAYERVTTDYLLEAVCAHGFGIDCVKFDASDQHSHSATQQTASARTLSTRDSASATTNRVSVYAATMPVTGLTDGDVLDNRFRAYPLFGDSASVLDSNTGTTPPDERLTPLKLLLDAGGNYVCYATCDPVNGNDGTGVASPTLATADANKYKNPAAAAAGIKAYNNANRSRNTVDGGTIYLIDGNHKGIGSFAGGNSTAYCTVTHHPTLGSKTGAIVNAAGTGFGTTGYWKFSGITFNTTAALLLIGDTSSVLSLDDCPLTLSGAEAIGLWGLAHATNCAVHTLPNGFIPNNGDKCPFGLVRGCAFDSVTLASFYCILGCTQVKPMFGGTLTTQASANAIAGWNTAYGVTGQWMGTSAGGSHGDNLALLGNVVEHTGADPDSLLDFSTADMGNLIRLHNSFVGQRVNIENDFNTPHNYSFTNGTSLFNVYTARGNHRADISATDGTIVGFWWEDNSVGHWGDWNEGAAVGAFAGDQDFWGINCNSTGAAGFVDDQSTTGSDGGNGDYHPDTGSSLLNGVTSGMALLEYDLAGTAIPNNGTGSIGGLQLSTPSTITGVATESRLDSVAVSWTSDPLAATYNVYRNSTASGTLPPTGGTIIGSTAATSYLDTTAVPGTTYYYSVTGVSSGSVEGERSAEAAGTRRRGGGSVVFFPRRSILR